MPVPTFTGMGPNPTFDDVTRKINTLVNELRNLMLSLDTLNVVELDADVIIANTITASKIAAGAVGTDQIADLAIITSKILGGAVTATEIADAAIIATKIAAGAVIAGKIAANTITATEIAANTITADRMNVTQLSAIAANLGTITAGLLQAVTIISSTITGGVIRTAETGERIELSTNQMKVYNATNQLLGLFLGLSGGGYSYGDALFYDNGTLVMEFYNNLGGQGYTIRPVGTALLGLGTLGKTTYGYGTWIFHSSASVDVQGTFQVHSGTAFDTITQSGTSGATLAQLEAQVNTIIQNLRAMNIYAT